MKKAVLIVLFAFLIWPGSVWASLVISPPFYPVVETAQKAIIWYENGIETLILSTSFRGSPRDFGWLIPVPGKPEVEQASDELYTALEDLTLPKVSVDRGPLTLPLGGVGMPSTDKSFVVEPTVVETKAVDIFDIATLEAKDENSLTDWLSKNGYSYPSDRSSLIKSYVEAGWYFVAVKVNSSALNVAQTYLQDGHATPVKITFASQNIVYPIKLSGPGIDVNKGGKKVAAYSFEGRAENFTTTFYSDTSKPASSKVNLALDNNNSYHGSTSLKLSTSNLEGVKDFGAQGYIYNLQSGKTYTFSAWAKSTSAQKNGSVSISVLGNLGESPHVNTAALSTWQRLTLTFVAKSTSAFLSLNSHDFSQEETINWDAIQVEEGNAASDFTEEVIRGSQDQAKSNLYPKNVDQVTILLYVFADHKKELPGFTTSYASWVSPKSISKLAFTPDGAKPWIEAKKKMYLTKLSRTMKPSEMTTDLIMRDADNNNPVNADGAPDVGTFRFFTVVILALVLEVGAIVGYIIYRRSKIHV